MISCAHLTGRFLITNGGNASAGKPELRDERVPMKRSLQSADEKEYPATPSSSPRIDLSRRGKDSGRAITPKGFKMIRYFTQTLLHGVGAWMQSRTAYSCRRTIECALKHQISTLGFAMLVLAIGQSDAAPNQKAVASDPPNIVLIMADDLGYAQTGYYHHPLLKTPNLDELAAGGLRLNRFYAAGPVCSPTRASVLTGRTHERTGVMEAGFALRHQEHSIAKILSANGYAAGHFGKWHLDGFRGPGVPIFADDPFGPEPFGFQTWISVTNFFDVDPMLSRQGTFEAFHGDSSVIVADEMVQFAIQKVEANQPFFAAVWFGTPHSPFRSIEQDLQTLRGKPTDPDYEERQKILASMDASSLRHHGELVGMDRAIGIIRAGLESLGILNDTLIWFNSDNGGLQDIKPSATAPLRGHKGQLYEGGIRVPAVLHWPARIEAGRVSDFPACTTDIAPTLLDIVGLPMEQLVQPIDGISLVALLDSEQGLRENPIGFRFRSELAVIDNEWKLIRPAPRKKQVSNERDYIGTPGVELYRLDRDIAETNDVQQQYPDVVQRLNRWLDEWSASVDASVAGSDYPEKKVDANHPEARSWTDVPKYQAEFDRFRGRPEYDGWLNRAEMEK